ncbi:MAG: copper chaperone PCu(A)C [Methylophilaceae bacterium]|nr:copper chaperone PCu(A)C [Methylophilaceae bacterium]
MLFQVFVFCIFGFIADNARAAEEITISHAWARATAPGQELGAAYMTLQSLANTSLFKVESTAAASVEIHSMTMKSGVMQMRKLDNLVLTANKLVALEPGGFHLMLIGLKKPLTAGDEIKLSLYFKKADGKVSVLHPQVSVLSGENRP